MSEVKNDLMFKLPFCDSRNGSEARMIALRCVVFAHACAHSAGSISKISAYLIKIRRVPNIKIIYFHHVKNAESLFNLLLKMTVRTQTMKLQLWSIVFIL